MGTVNFRVPVCFVLSQGCQKSPTQNFHARRGSGEVAVDPVAKFGKWGMSKNQQKGELHDHEIKLTLI